VGIILLTSIIFGYFKYEEEREKLREGNFFDDPGGAIRDIFNPIGEDIKNSVTNDILKPITDLINKVKDDIIKKILEPIQPIIDFLKYIPNRQRKLTASINSITEGIKIGWTNLGASLKVANDDIDGFFPLIGKFFNHYLASRLKCSFEKMGNFKKCFKYYLCELVGEMLYSIIVRLPLFLINLIVGYDLTPQVNMGWDVLYTIDDFLYEMFHYHFMKWSDDIMDQCYLCSDIYPMPGFIEQMNRIHADFNETDPDFRTLKKDPNHRTIPNLMNEPAAKFAQSKIEMDAVYRKDYDDRTDAYVQNDIDKLAKTSTHPSTEASPDFQPYPVETKAILQQGNYVRHSLADDFASLGK